MRPQRLWRSTRRRRDHWRFTLRTGSATRRPFHPASSIFLAMSWSSARTLRTDCRPPMSARACLRMSMLLPTTASMPATALAAMFTQAMKPERWMFSIAAGAVSSPRPMTGLETTPTAGSRIPATVRRR